MRISSINSLRLQKPAKSANFKMHSDSCISFTSKENITKAVPALVGAAVALGAMVKIFKDKDKSKELDVKTAAAGIQAKILYNEGKSLFYETSALVEKARNDGFVNKNNSECCFIYDSNKGLTTPSSLMFYSNGTQPVNVLFDDKFNIRKISKKESDGETEKLFIFKQNGEIDSASEFYRDANNNKKEDAYYYKANDLDVVFMEVDKINSSIERAKAIYIYSDFYNCELVYEDAIIDSNNGNLALKSYHRNEKGKFKKFDAKLDRSFAPFVED